MKKRILHIDVDAFFVSVEEVLDPSLKGKPTIVGGDPSDRGVVAAASYPARKYGVHSAMPMAQAKRLCPNGVFLRGNPKAYNDFSERIFNIFSDWSPCVQPISLDEAYLDFTGCERLHGPILKAAQRIRDHIKREVGVNCSVGIASNKLMAKIASDYCKPSGMLWVADGMEQKLLAPLAIERIPGVGSKTGGKLRRMGIKTIGQLAALPRKWLEDAFGQYGKELHDRACGLCTSPVVRRTNVRSISRETTFRRDSGDPSFLLSTLSYLVERVTGQLRNEALYARCVTLKLRDCDFNTITRSQTLSNASREDRVFYKTASGLFWKAFNCRIPVRLIGVGLKLLTKHSTIQTDLFSDVQPERWDELYRSIDRIREKYGFKSILHGSSWVSSK